jgi:outer membrane translocation and assembly module TamA
VPLGLAVFADAARVGSSPSTANSAPRWFVDVGLGLRVGLPGLADGLRVDWATGLVDGGSAISLGWQRSWK